MLILTNNSHGSTARSRPAEAVAYLKPPRLDLDDADDQREPSLAGRFKPSAYNHLVDYSDGRLIVFNALNTATAVVAPERRRDVETLLGPGSFEAGDADDELLRLLASGRLIVPAGLDERGVVRRRLARGRGRRDTLMLTVAPTMGCNFNCTYCIEPEEFRREVQVMGGDVQDAIVELVRQHVDDGVRHVNLSWFGGEPLLAVDAIVSISHRLIEVCEERGAEYAGSITTNGFRLRDDVIDRLRTCRIGFLKISLDGPPHIHDQRRVLRGGQGTFRRILANIAAASQHMKVKIRVNVDRENEAELSALLDELQAAGLGPHVQVSPAIVEQNAAIEGRYTQFSTRESFAAAQHRFLTVAENTPFAHPSLPSIMGNFCSADFGRGLMIGPLGELYACWADFGNPDKRVGSILPFTRSNQNYLRQYTDFDPTIDPKCTSCTVLPLCLGGCSRERLYLGEPQCLPVKFNLADRVRSYADHWFDTHPA